MLMNFILGLTTLFLLGAFTLLYISKFLQEKPEFLTKAVNFITVNLEKLSFYGMIYALVIAFLTPIMVGNTTDMFVRLIANIVLLVMALPYGFNKISPAQQSKINPAILREFQNFITRTTAQEKIVGIIGAIATLFLFGVLFR